jgi:uncharacterized protein YjbI with pentapeptide repeats
MICVWHTPGYLGNASSTRCYLQAKRFSRNLMADERHDQTFFLTLAEKGKDAWNAWRRNRANKDVRVTFAGIDFSEAPRDEIDFSGLYFGDNADFSGCKWRGVDFTGGVFGAEADFTDAAFGDESFFSLATFGRFANFTGATIR